MIYITDNTTDILIPKVSFNGVSGVTFENQITHKVITINTVDKTPFDYWYTFDISSIINQFSVGQYDYKVTADNIIYASGIAQFGDFIPAPTSYTTDINIKTYGG